MIGLEERQQRALRALQQATQHSLHFFDTIDPDLSTGYQTAHEVLAALVFLQCEHVTVLQALLNGQTPDLRTGTFAALRQEACQCHKDTPTAELAREYKTQSNTLINLLQQVPDWTVNFPLKAGGRTSTVEDRVFALAAHMENQMADLRRAAVNQQPPEPVPPMLDDRQLQLLN